MFIHRCCAHSHPFTVGLSILLTYILRDNGDFTSIMARRRKNSKSSHEKPFHFHYWQYINTPLLLKKTRTNKKKLPMIRAQQKHILFLFCFTWRNQRQQTSDAHPKTIERQRHALFFCFNWRCSITVNFRCYLH